MSKLTPEEFRAYLKTVRELAEGPFEEMQKEVEVTNKFPQEFIDLAIENNLYRYALPEEYGGWGLSEKEILQVQEEFSRGPGGMRMHLHYAADLNWRILDDYGKPELKAEYMDKFCDKTIFTCFALTEQTGGTGADLHSTAVKDENGNYVLNGEKWLISHTDVAQFAYVIAVTDPDKKGDERLSAFFVPMDAPGFELVPMPHMMGCRGAGHAGFKMTNVTCSIPEVPPRRRGPGHGGGHALPRHLPRAHRRLQPRHVRSACSRSVHRSRPRLASPSASRSSSARPSSVKLANMATMTARPALHGHGLRRRSTTGIPTASTSPRRPPCASCSPSTARANRVRRDARDLRRRRLLRGLPRYGPTERLYRDCRAMWLEEGAPDRAAHHHRPRASTSTTAT